MLGLKELKELNERKTDTRTFEEKFITPHVNGMSHQRELPAPTGDIDRVKVALRLNTELSKLLREMSSEEIDRFLAKDEEAYHESLRLDSLASNPKACEPF